MTTLRWTRTDEYDFTPADLAAAQADRVDLADPEALFWWLNPQGTRWPVMTRPVVETYEFVDPWAPPHTQRYGLVVNWIGRLDRTELNSTTTDLTPGRRKPGKPVSARSFPVPGPR